MTGYVVCRAYNGTGRSPRGAVACVKCNGWGTVRAPVTKSGYEITNPHLLR